MWILHYNASTLIYLFIMVLYTVQCTYVHSYSCTGSCTYKTKKNLWLKSSSALDSAVTPYFLYKTVLYTQLYSAPKSHTYIQNKVALRAQTTYFLCSIHTTIKTMPVLPSPVHHPPPPPGLPTMLEMERNNSVFFTKLCSVLRSPHAVSTKKHTLFCVAQQTSRGPRFQSGISHNDPGRCRIIV